jgi:hypothetical protein
MKDRRYIYGFVAFVLGSAFVYFLRYKCEVSLDWIRFIEGCVIVIGSVCYAIFKYPAFFYLKNLKKVEKIKEIYIYSFLITIITIAIAVAFVLFYNSILAFPPNMASYLLISFVLMPNILVAFKYWVKWVKRW